MRHLTLKLLILSGFALSGCATKAVPFDQKPARFATASDIAERAAAAAIDCNKSSAQPIVRIPPHFPPAANRTGKVGFIFDLDDVGVPTNIRITDATEEVFVRAATRSLGGWKYVGKYPGESNAKRENNCTTVTFLLVDDRGVRLPSWRDIETQNSAYDKYIKSLKTSKK